MDAVQKTRPAVRGGPIATAVLACALAAGLAAAAPFAAASDGTGAKPAAHRIAYARIQHVCAAPQPSHASCFALVRTPAPASEAASPGVRPFALGAGAATAGPAGGLTPAELASAYGYDPTASGAGQTIAIVDAFDDPNIESDLAAFDAQYKLPSCTTLNGCFEKVGQTGKATLLPGVDKSGWSVEITLDVEAAHAACPNCSILLVEAENALFTNLTAAVNEAVALGATVVSNSYGGPEEHAPFSEAGYNHPGVVMVASSGDSGYYGWVARKEGFVPPQRPNIPSSLPTVVSVGGTSLGLNESGHRVSETVWNGNGPRGSSSFVEGASGGGCSTLFSAQPWQHAVSGFGATGCGAARLSADVAAVADPLTGFDIYDTYNCGEACERFKLGASWLTIGGTSLSAPLVSGMYALAGGSNHVSYPAMTLYGHLGDASLFDVKQGGNGACDEGGLPCGLNKLLGYKLDCEGTTACNAAAGFDGPTGVGTPSSLDLFRPRLPLAAFAVPAVPAAGIPTSFNAASSTDPYPGGAISSYSWSWGDGTAPSSGVAPTHAFATPGSYKVALVVSDVGGLESAPATATVTVPVGGGAAGGTTPPAVGVESFHAVLPPPPPPPPPPPVPDARLASTSLQVSAAGVVTLEVSCPPAESSCAGTVTLRTAGAVAAGRKARVLTLGSARFTVAGGTVVAVKLHLSAKARALLKRRHTLRVRVGILAHDGAGASHSGAATAVLHLSGRHR